MAKPRNSRRVEGDRISVSNVGQNAAVAAGQGASASTKVVISQTLAADIAAWRSQMEQEIDEQPKLSNGEKQDLKDQVAKIESEVTKGTQAEVSRLEKLLNTLAVMGPDIWEVATTSIMNPLAGIGLVIKKIGNKIELERSA